MITSDGKKLEIFERFRIDYELPKHRPPEVDDDDINVSEDMMDGFTISRKATVVDLSSFSRGISIEEVGDSMVLVGSHERKSLFTRLWMWFATLTKPKKKEMSVIDFFTAVKKSTLQLDIVQERAAGYEKAIKNAKALGQRALVEQLEENLMAVRSEAHLVQMDKPVYLTEETLVNFVKKSKRGLRLDWVANFTRFIPEDILEVKKECDQRMVFDNYVILHYDPETKAYGETHAEKAAKKDPILFGVMKGRRRLYYVGDWIDEVCDLTLDQIADSLGESVLEKIK